MRPFVINGEAWGVTRVSAGDPRLIDWTGTERVATADPSSRTVYVNDMLVPPLLDQVMLHEVAHAIVSSWGMRGSGTDWSNIDEWGAQLVERHSIEAINAASEALGRPVCVNGLCCKCLPE